MYDWKQETEQGTIKRIAPCLSRPFTPWMKFPRTVLISIFSCLFTSQYNFIGTPQELSHSITCNGDSFRMRETLTGCDSRRILISLQCSSNYGLQLCVQNILSLRISLKRKHFVYLRHEKCKPQLHVLGFWPSAVPTQAIPGRKEAFADAASLVGYLPVCLELMIYWALNFSYQKQILLDQKQKS